MLRRSTLLILLPAFAVASVGWFARTPLLTLPAGAALVQRRAAWQPSPIATNWAAPVLPTRTPTPSGGAPLPAGTPAPTRTVAPGLVTPPASTAVATSGTATSGTATSGTATSGTATPPRPTVAATASVPVSGSATAARTPAATGPTSTPIPRVAGRGEWGEEHVESKALGQRLPFLIWVPPGYTTSQRYPVVYLLHGAGDGFTAGRAEWFNLGMKDAIDEAYAAREIPPAIFVFPEGLQGYWINHANGGPRWADYVTQDLVPHVDRIWSTDARPERRAVGGLSMGGHAALHLALNNPTMFRVAGAHSPALRSLSESPPFFGDQAWFERFDPLTLAAKPGAAARLKAWIDVGANDRWRPDAERISTALQKNGATVDLQVYPGRHEGSYWTAHLREYLRFYGEGVSPR
ncbi:MAG TPA: alpha/beta hydrolase-fold protein [Chloroflexota bacterium]|nr:alpha/beta hydrolase-fold protein [Chloroflexota bacterium]